MKANDYQLERHLQAYVQAGKDLGSEFVMLPVAVDKSRVHGRGVSNCACFLPDNRAWWLPPQASDGKSTQFIVLVSYASRSNNEAKLFNLI